MWWPQSSDVTIPATLRGGKVAGKGGAKGEEGRVRKVGSYELLGEISAGGMATVHLGRLSGPAGFARVVAVKRLRAQFAKDPDFVSMLLDEARLAARIRHPNVVPTLDVVSEAGELFLVMDYVEGESLSRLLRRIREKSKIPVPIASAIVGNALRGVHAAHEVRSDDGELLQIVHRDVSPHNVIVGTDGLARLADFGVAKAIGRLQTTREGQVKGKLPYMAPEQVRGQKVTRRTDVYSAGVVLWECLVGERLFAGDETEVLERVLLGAIEPPSSRVPDLPHELDAIVMRATSRDPNVRYETAAEMADALEHAVRPALPSEVARWLDDIAGASIKQRAGRVAEEVGSDPNAQATSSSGALPGARSLEATGGDPDGKPHASALEETATLPRVRNARRARAFVLGFAMAAGAVCVALLVAKPRRSKDAAVTPEPPAASAPVLATAVVDEPADAASEPTASPSASASSTSPTSARAPARPRLRPAAGAGARPHPAHVDCTVPFVIDANGKRTYRRECLR
jgi:serine/threonine-protein kinase